MPAPFTETSTPRDRTDGVRAGPAPTDGSEGRPGPARTEDPAAPLAGTDAVSELLGGIDAETSDDVDVPERLVDQVIGQDRARDAILKAAAQRRHVLMIGSPGVGKSMLARAMSELLPAGRLGDVLVFHDPDDPNEPLVREVPAGAGEATVSAHRRQLRKALRARRRLSWLLILGVLGFAVFWAGDPLLGLVAAGILWFVLRPGRAARSAGLPKLLVDNGGRETSPFVDASGTHAGALLGDVRHDPYQSGGMETPAHRRVEAGAIHRASGGVLYVDEVNTLDPRSQQHLLTAMQERAFPITGQSENSAGALVHTEPVPTDFVLVAAGNLDAVEGMHPALRSRVKGNGYEVYMDDSIEDTPENRARFARFVAQEVRNDGRLPPFDRGAMAAVVLEARRRAGRKGHLTLRLRELGGLVRVAGDLARDEGAPLTTADHVRRARRRARSIESQLADEYVERQRQYDLAVDEGAVVGRVNGLAVLGEDSGVVLPVVAEVTPSQGEGRVIATGKLQDVASEAVQNVSAIVKRFSTTDLSARDIHVQFVGAASGVEGDSASVTVATAVISALEDAPVDQSVAMTGSLSIRGDVLPVGGVTYKVEAAARAGFDTVLVPAANLDDVNLDEDLQGTVEVVPVSHVGDVLAVAFRGTPARDGLVERITRLSGRTARAGAGLVGGAGTGADPDPAGRDGGDHDRIAGTAGRPGPGRSA